MTARAFGFATNGFLLAGFAGGQPAKIRHPKRWLPINCRFFFPRAIPTLCKPPRRGVASAQRIDTVSLQPISEKCVQSLLHSLAVHGTPAFAKQAVRLLKNLLYSRSDRDGFHGRLLLVL